MGDRRLIAEGFSNEEIAERLVLVPGTVANRVEGILTRLSFRGRTHVAVWAVEHGLYCRGLPTGNHGIHIHAVGRCDPPDFMSAGAHFNPTNRQHGLQNPNSPHASDLPNLQVGADGTGRLDALDRDVTLASGANSLFDADGSALVIHAGEDDNMTDPAGNSGGRIARGIIRDA